MALTGQELRAKSASDLEKLITEKRSALSAFRFSVAGGKTKNVRAGRMLRREIAAILTVLGEK